MSFPFFNDSLFLQPFNKELEGYYKQYLLAKRLANKCTDIFERHIGVEVLEFSVMPACFYDSKPNYIADIVLQQNSFLSAPFLPVCAGNIAIIDEEKNHIKLSLYIDSTLFNKIEHEKKVEQLFDIVYGQLEQKHVFVKEFEKLPEEKSEESPGILNILESEETSKKIIKTLCEAIPDSFEYSLSRVLYLNLIQDLSLEIEENKIEVDNLLEGRFSRKNTTAPPYNVTCFKSDICTFKAFYIFSTAVETCKTISSASYRLDKVKEYFSGLGISEIADEQVKYIFLRFKLMLQQCLRQVVSDGFAEYKKFDFS